MSRVPRITIPKIGRMLALMFYAVLRTKTLPSTAKRSGVLQYSEAYGYLVPFQQVFPLEQSFTFSFKILVRSVPMFLSLVHTPGF